MVSSCNQKLSDFEILKKIVNKELHMEDIDSETKIRLINLCDNRIKEINKKIDIIDRKIDNMKKK